MTNWHALTEAFAREYRSRWCKDDQHAPAPGCDGYYPPGPDTYRCLCACHEQPPAEPTAPETFPGPFQGDATEIRVARGAFVDADKLHLVDPVDMIMNGPWICSRCGQDIKQVPDCPGGTGRCRKCRTPFDETDHRFDGPARHADSPWCKRCVDRCHEATDFDHACLVCTGSSP